MPELTDRQRDGRVAPRPAGRAEDSRARIDRLLFERRDAGDWHARDELIERFLPLARSLSRRYDRSDESLEDLMQVASLALVKAVDRFDATRGCAFSSFAVPTIVGELKRHFRDRAWAVRPPRDVQERALRVDRAAERLTKELQRAPTVTELAAAIHSTHELVLEALEASTGRNALSLQVPGNGDDDQSELQDTLGAIDDGYARAESRALLDALLVGVSSRSREVLRLRFEHDLNQAEIGARLGVSQMQISRILRQAVDQLRYVADRHDEVHARRAGRS